MAYLFDDASSQRISKASVIGFYSVSLWFYPDDSGALCTLYSEHNSTGTQHARIVILGSTTDKVALQCLPSAPTLPTVVTSTGTVNYNEWNHVYAARGAASPTAGYISLNGESLVTGSYNGGGSTVATAIGCTGGALARFDYMSGRIAEVGIWNSCLSDYGDRWQALALGHIPPLIPQDPNDDTGVGGAPLNLISYTPLIGNFADRAAGNSWSVSVSPTIAEHCRTFRGLTE